MDKVGIGVLSHAHGHVTSYCRVMQHFDDVDLIASWDDKTERGRRATDSFGMEFRSSPEDIVNDARIDAVMIGAETNRHAEFVELAAGAGKHILLQKPMATTVAGVNTTEIYGDGGTIIQDFGDSPSTSAPRPDNAVPLKYIRRGDKQWTEFAMDIPGGQGDRIAAVPRPFVDYIRGLTDERVSSSQCGVWEYGASDRMQSPIFTPSVQFSGRPENWMCPHSLFHVCI